MSGKLGVMGGFLDGTAAYVLSFTWHQLLSIYIFNLHPRPWGGGGEQASSIAMLRFAAGLCVVAGLVQHLARSSVCASLPGAETVPSMTGMLAGWAGGDTFLQLFRELRALPEQVPFCLLRHGDRLVQEGREHGPSERWRVPPEALSASTGAHAEHSGRARY